MERARRAACFDQAPVAWLWQGGRLFGGNGGWTRSVTSLSHHPQGLAERHPASRTEMGGSWHLLRALLVCLTRAAFSNLALAFILVWRLRYRAPDPLAVFGQ